MDDASSEPAIMSLDLLREITNDFSEERKLGSGTFGKVYMGVHQGGEKIAVKKLYDMPGLDEENFQNEFKNLTRLRHKNIVRLVGYCHDVQEVQVKHEGKLVLAQRTNRAFCLEYMSNGSLDEYISDECDRYDWYTCYGIIKGICEGLKYLHKELKPPIYHLDLKPANVLLDENMVPRIADFGMSMLFGDEQTRVTKSSYGTLGYSPPEFIRSNLISNKFDIFSLGVVIIKIMAGRAGYFDSSEMCSQEFTNLVQESWTNRLLETSNLKNAYSEQVKICIQIGLNCVQENRHKRPTIQDIVDRLNETETKCTYAVRKDSMINQDSLGDITQPGNISNPNHQQATPSRNNLSSSYRMEEDRSTFPQYTQYPNDQHVEQINDGSTFNQNIVDATQSIWFEENAGPTEARLDGDSRDDNEEYSADGDPLPGIEGLEIVGNPRPGSSLKAWCFPINGTTRGNFQETYRGSASAACPCRRCRRCPSGSSAPSTSGTTTGRSSSRSRSSSSSASTTSPSPRFSTPLATVKDEPEEKPVRKRSVGGGIVIRERSASPSPPRGHLRLVKPKKEWTSPPEYKAAALQLKIANDPEEFLCQRVAMLASFDDVPVASREFAEVWSAEEHMREQTERSRLLGLFVDLDTDDELGPSKPGRGDGGQGCSCRPAPKQEPPGDSDDDEEDYTSMYRRLGLGGH